MKRSILFSLIFLAGGAQGGIWGETLDNFILVCIMTVVGGIVIGYIGAYIIDRS